MWSLSTLSVSSSSSSFIEELTPKNGYLILLKFEVNASAFLIKINDAIQLKHLEG